MCLKGRDFEVPMSGGLYLTQHNPELELVYKIGQEILTYHDVDDCAATIRAIVTDLDRAASIRQAGRAPGAARSHLRSPLDAALHAWGLVGRHSRY